LARLAITSGESSTAAGAGCAGGRGTDARSRGGGLGLVGEGGGELGVAVFGEVGAELGGGGGVLGVPDEGLAEGLEGFGAVGMAVEVAAAFRASLGVVGEDAAEGDLVAGVGGVLFGEGAETGDGVGSSLLGGGLGLVVGEGPITGGRGIAEDLAVDGHRLSVLAGLGVFARLLEGGGLALLGTDAVDAGEAGIFGIDGAEALDVGVGEGEIAAELGGAGEATESLGIVGIGEQDLLPGLGGHVHASANFEGVRAFEQVLGRALLSLRKGWDSDGGAGDCAAEEG